MAGAALSTSCSAGPGAAGGAGGASESGSASASPSATAAASGGAAAKFPVPGGAITVLPGTEPTLLLGIDDGVNTEAVRDWCTFARDADLRLVFFGNGCYDSWADVTRTLRPMVESGQIQLGNHTLNHPKLTLLGDREIAQELTANAKVFRKLYGVDLAPWFRPPYGLHNDRVDKVAADLGYHPPVLWADSFVDWGETSTPYYKQVARRCFQPRNVVLAHANKPDVAPAYSTFVDIIHERKLRTVTLDDVYRG